MIGLIIAIVIIALGGGAGYIAYQNFAKKKKERGIISAIAAGVCALILVLVPMSVHTVEAGEIAVVKNLGKAEKVRY